MDSHYVLNGAIAVGMLVVTWHSVLGLGEYLRWRDQEVRTKTWTEAEAHFTAFYGRQHQMPEEVP